VSLEIQIDTKSLKDIDKKLRQLKPKAIYPATRRSLSRSATTMNKHAVKAVSHELSIKQKEVKEKKIVVTKKPNFKKLNASVYVNTRKRSAFKEGYTPAGVDRFLNKTLRTGYSIAPIKEHHKQEARGRSFIATMKSGRTGIFVRVAGRTKQKRNSNNQLYTSSKVAEVYSSIDAKRLIKPYVKFIQDEGLKTFRKRYQKEISRELEKLGF